jgi:hypothetical protein
LVYSTNQSQNRQITTGLSNRRPDVLVISGNKNKNKGSRDLDIYITTYSGVPSKNRTLSCVAILIRKEERSKIMNYEWI